MDEVELSAKLEEHLAVPNLVVQTVKGEEWLVVVFNRPEQEHLNYKELAKRTISKLQSLRIPPPKQIIFYSRVLGEEVTDWQATVNIKVKEDIPKSEEVAEDNRKITSASENPTSIVEPQTKNEPVEEKAAALKVPADQPEPISPSSTTPRQLSDFCFTRNKLLVKTDLPAPDRQIAENVKFFNQLNESTQLELAPVLEEFFKNPDKTSLISLPVELRGWLEELKKLEDTKFRSQAVWLSRYCYDREKTMMEVNAALKSLAEIEKAKQREFESRPASVKTQLPQRSTTSSSSRALSDKPRGSQKFTSDELVLMIGVGLLIGAIGWFLWGTAAAFSVFGWTTAIASVASGVGTALGNQVIKTVTGIILIIIYIIFWGIVYYGLRFWVG